jgi:hypothetical protein
VLRAPWHISADLIYGTQPGLVPVIASYPRPEKHLVSSARTDIKSWIPPDERKFAALLVFGQEKSDRVTVKERGSKG